MLKINLKKKVKKKEKPKKFVGKGLKIVDEDSFGGGGFKPPSEESDPDEADELPQIAAVVDERPVEVQLLESFNKGKWKRVEEDVDKESPSNASKDLRRDTEGDISPPRQRKRRDSDDASPPRRKRHDSGDISPPRARRRRDSDDISPPRQRRRDSRDISPPRKSRQRRDSDDSPPRSSRRRSPDGDFPSRQRRRRDSDDISPPRQRKRRDSGDISPPRQRRRNSGDKSPPRQRRRRDSGDISPPRQSRRRSPDDISPPRQRRRRDSGDISPPRQRRRRDSGDISPPRQRRRDDNDMSPPRQRRRDHHNRDRNVAQPRVLDTDSTEDGKSKTTLDGKRAGLQKATALREEMLDFRKRENEMFELLPEEVSGRNAKAVRRDRRTEEDRAREAEKEKKESERKKQYDKWGKGLKQVEEQQERVRSALHEMAKPLARSKDDVDLDDHLKNINREGDPMAEYLAAKRRKAQGGQEKPKYKGPPPPPNRFNIPPGFRWDGVDRSNGYEKEWFGRINARKAVEEEAYKWSVEDL